MAVATFTPEQVLRSIRYDPLTKKGSVLDVVQLVTQCGQANATKVFQRITDQFPELLPRCQNLKFPGRGQRPTPVAFLKDLIEIAWLCPGKHAKEFRRTGAVTLCRALGGDLSLVDEIRARHQDISEEEQEALLAGTGVTVAEANGQALVIPVDEQLRRYRAETMMIEEDARRAALDNVELAVKRMQAWAAEEADPRHRLFLEDTTRNMFMRYGALATGTEAQEVEVRLPLTISEVAAQMGHKRLTSGQLAAIGKLAARLYREAHGEAPHKHLQYVDGAARQVNSYTTADRELLEEAVRLAMSACGYLG